MAHCIGMRSNLSRVIATHVSCGLNQSSLSVQGIRHYINKPDFSKFASQPANLKTGEAYNLWTTHKTAIPQNAIMHASEAQRDGPMIMGNSIAEPRFVMPVESARHAFTMMAFPSIDSAMDDDHLERMQTEVIRVANAIAKYEPVQVYARKELVARAQSMARSNVAVKEIHVNELWIRDSGPVFASNTTTGQQTAINFNFSYWGGKLPLKGDEKAADLIASAEKKPLFRSTLVLEGGAIEHDGDGTFLGAESCILNDNRNPSTSRSQIESELRAMLGVQHFIWVPGVKGYDITDCHIDALARFIEPGVVLLSKPAPNGPQPMITAYKEALHTLQESTDARGRSLTIHECEEPDLDLLGASGDAENEVIASYANFYIVNDAVIIPEFGQSGPDKEAFALFQKLFPSREVVPVYINMLPRTGGGIHCATQQVPL